MFFAAAVPALYLGTIVYSGLEVWIYGKITGEKNISDYESEVSDIES